MYKNSRLCIQNREKKIYNELSNDSRRGRRRKYNTIGLSTYIHIYNTSMMGLTIITKILG